MKVNLRLLSAGLLLSVSGTVLADSYVARNAGMGGAGVASSNYAGASTANPALLTQFDPDDDWAIIIPALGGIVSDEDEILDSLDIIADTVDLLRLQIDNLDPGAIESKDQIISELKRIDGVPAGAQLSGLISVSNPGKSLGWAVGVQTYVEAGALADYVETDEALINEAIFNEDSGVLDDLESSGIALGAAVTELTLSLAHEFNLAGTRLSVGVTPKFQRVDTALYQSTVADFNSDDFEFDSDTYANDDSNINLDIGVAWWATENINFGLMVRDLIAKDYSTVVLNGTGPLGVSSADYVVDTKATLGVAWSSRLFTAAFDIDLTKNESFSNLVVNGNPIAADGVLFGETQFARLGAEFNAFDWAQMRVGFRTDLEDTRDDLYTLGLGLSPFDVFHLDLTGFIGEQDTYGGLVEIRLTF